MSKSKQTTLSFGFKKTTTNNTTNINKENYIIIEEKDEASQPVVVPVTRPIINDKPILVITDEESNKTFLSVNSNTRRARSSSIETFEPKLKDIKLTQSPNNKSNCDSDFFDAIENLENEYKELQKDELHQILQNDENTFLVVSAKDNNDNLYEYQDLFANFGLLNANGDLRCKLKVLGLKHQLIKTERIFTCILTGTWSESDIEARDEVQVFGRFCQDFLAILIQNSFDQERSLFNQHFIIVEPSILLPPTTITTALPCNRRGVLTTYIGGRDDVSLPLLKGSMLHNIFEQLSTTNDLAFQPDKLEELVQSYIDSNIESFYFLKTDMTAFLKEIKNSVKDAQDWVIQHFKQQKELEFWNGTANSTMRVLQVVNAEQMMTSHNLGLKGKTDLVLFCEVTTVKDGVTELKRCFVPFELKTGEREVTIYNMQTLVYCVLLMQQHKQYEGVNGILYYMKLKKLIEVKFRNFEVFSILNKRNLLAKHYKKFEKSNDGTCFPPMINNASECNRCYQNFTCSVINLTLEDQRQKKPVNNSRKRLFPQKTMPDIEDFQVDPSFKQYYEVEKLITGQKKAYLKKWFNLIHLEEVYERELYSTNAKEDSSFYMIELENFDELKEHVKNTLNQEPHKPIILKFSKSFDDKDSIHNFLDNFKPMDYVGLTQSSLSCSLRGNVVEKRMKKIKQEKKKFFLGYIFVRCFINEANINPEKIEYINSNEMQTLWSIDNKRKNFFPLMRWNLLELIVNPEYQRLYELIVENQVPKFDDDPEKLKPFEMLYKKKRGSNADQMNAIERCLQTKDYNIVLGMPGTGKTYVIVLLIRILLDRGDKIILSSYTHSAIDNILKRFVEKYPTYRDKLLRIASNPNQVDESIRDLVYQKKNFKSIKALSDYFDSKQLFAVTCLACSNIVFGNRRFDTCIIDEASQALEPAALGPINLAKKFILFGDHHQLQPLVKSKDAQDRGMQVSLFERLINKNPNAVSTLSFQYRMNEDIMHISNTLIYDNRLQIDNPLIRQSSIDIPYVKLIYDKKWLLDVLNPERRVIFLNLDCIKALKKIIHGEKTYTQDLFSRYDDNSMPENERESQESYHSDNFALLDEKFNSQMSLTQLSKSQYSAADGDHDGEGNKLDLKLAVYLTRMLLNCGVKPEDIAVITPLNSERTYILSKLDKSKVEVFTVDKSQGIDKSCVIINLSLENKGKEFLLTNPRRINVAFTRAKQKLIVIGSVVNLKKMENMNKFIDIIVDKRWVYNMEDYMMEAVEEKCHDEFSNKASIHSKFITQ